MAEEKTQKTWNPRKNSAGMEEEYKGQQYLKTWEELGIQPPGWSNHKDKEPKPSPVKAAKEDYDRMKAEIQCLVDEGALPKPRDCQSYIPRAIGIVVKGLP